MDGKLPSLQDIYASTSVTYRDGLVSVRIYTAFTMMNHLRITGLNC